MLPPAVLVLACALVGAQSVAGSQVDLADAHLDVPELIAKYGYPVETHSVLTRDNYLLELHRIPRGRDRNNDPAARRPPVLVMHGLLSSSADYIIMGPQQGLGYILAEEGFDVWLGNARGNYYSRRHTRLNPDSFLDKDFWDFSWEQIGSNDLSAMVDYVIANTGYDSVHYIGHSQGTTTFLVLNSLRPEYNDKIKTAHLMAPVAYFENFDSETIASLSEYANTLTNVGTRVGLSELFPRGSAVEYVDGKPRCVQSNPLSSICEQFMQSFASQDLSQFNTDMLPVILGHTPAGSSLKQFAHYGQVIADNSFRRWSYTLPTQNLLAYGSLTPPVYDLTRVNCRITLHYSVADALTPENDVIALNNVLPRAQLRKVIQDTFTHFDFAWGSEAKYIVYDDILKTMKDYEQQA